MDLLGSILDKMDKPPVPSSNQKKKSNGILVYKCSVLDLVNHGHEKKGLYM